MLTHRLFGFCFGGLLIVSPLAANTLRTVALSGEVMPGVSTGGTFQYFAPPLLNDTGNVAFFSGISHFGIGAPDYAGYWAWSEEGGSLRLIAGMGDPAPGVAGGATLSFFNRLGFNNAGNTVIRAGLTGFGITGNNNFATYLETPEGLQLMSRRGDPAPGVSDGALFSSLVSPLMLNDAGQIAFRSELRNSSGFLLPPPGNEGIWSGGLESLDLAARGGTPAPGSDATFVGLRDPVINSAGKVAFSGTTLWGIWAGFPGSLELVARRNDPAAGAATGETYGSLFDPVVNSAGHLAFRGQVIAPNVANNRAGIWSDRSGALTIVVEGTEAAPGTSDGVQFVDIGLPVLNDAGRIAFVSTVGGSGVTATNDSGIWSEGSGALQLVAREGDVAPGVSGDVRFGHFSSSAIPPLVLNANNQIAFLGSLVGSGVTSGNDMGIWATDQSGALTLIVREGDLLEVSPNDFRTISELRFISGTGNADGRPSGFNNLGQLAFLARFSDQSEGTFVSSAVARAPIPEPSGMVLLMLACGSALATTRHGRPGATR